MTGFAPTAAASSRVFGSGRVQGIAPLHPPTPPDVPFSVSGGWSHPRSDGSRNRPPRPSASRAGPFFSGFRRQAGLELHPSGFTGSTLTPSGPAPGVLPPDPVLGVLDAPLDESSIRSVRLLRSFAPPALPGFFATMTSADFSKALTFETSPSKVLPLSPRAARLYLLRLDGLRVSLFLASSPPAPGLTAGSCPCGRGFACRFLQLHLAATPCGSAKVGSITSFRISHPLETAHVGHTRGAPCGRP